MSKNKNTLPQVPADLATPDPGEVKGMTISEIRYQRALVALQKEFCKEKIGHSVRKLKTSSPFSKNYDAGNSSFGRVGAIAGKLISGMSYLDYALIGFSVFSNVRKILKIAKPRKSKK